LKIKNITPQPNYHCRPLRAAFLCHNLSAASSLDDKQKLGFIEQITATKNNDYFVVVFLFATICNYFFNKWLVKNYPDQILVNPQTGQQVVYKDGSSFFFIPIKYWTYILFVFFLINLLVVYTSHMK
jgi:hypothetical protein